MYNNITVKDRRGSNIDVLVECYICGTKFSTTLNKEDGVDGQISRTCKFCGARNMIDLYGLWEGIYIA